MYVYIGSHNNPHQHFDCGSVVIRQVLDYLPELPPEVRRECEELHHLLSQPHFVVSIASLYLLQIIVDPEQQSMVHCICSLTVALNHCQS